MPERMAVHRSLFMVEMIFDLSIKVIPANIDNIELPDQGKKRYFIST